VFTPTLRVKGSVPLDRRRNAADNLHLAAMFVVIGGLRSNRSAFSKDGYWA
jgi:hypothetical protein